jgi:hypothetical protein
MKKRKNNKKPASVDQDKECQLDLSMVHQIQPFQSDMINAMNRNKLYFFIPQQSMGRIPVMVFSKNVPEHKKSNPKLKNLTQKNRPNVSNEKAWIDPT